MAQELDPLDVKSLGGESEDIQLKEPKACKHKFIYNTPGEIVCGKCHAGFFIRGDEHLKDGHLYKSGKKII
jgi:hypothetical protein